MRTLVTVGTLAAFAAAAAWSTPAPLASHRVRLRDVRFEAAQVLVPDARLDLPFGITWEGHRFDALEVGPGWVRLVVPGEILGELSARPLDGRGAERPLPTAGPRFVVLGDSRLSPTARTLVVSDGLFVAIRWTGLVAPGIAEPVTAEIVLDRLGPVRFQYLHVPLVARAPFVGIDDSNGTRVDLTSTGASAPLALRSGLAVEIPSPDPGLALEHAGPPPAGCVAPTESWCDIADGPTANASILLDSRFEEPIITWTPTGDWHLIPWTTCSPGATTPTGSSFSLASDTLCTASPGVTSTLAGPVVGPLGSQAFLSFSARAQLDPSDSAEILVNGSPIGSLPAGLDPATWYRFGPMALPAGAVQVAFRFTAGASAATRLGWMVDDVFIHEENTANWRCVQEARYNDGVPPLADCGDTEHDDWAFDESDFCLGCTYTFYAVVECGSEMHLPFRDMEGGEVKVTEMVAGASPRLTCSNDAFRNPSNLPVLRRQDCCAAPGQEIWTGPAFTATDNRGAGDVAWGLPGCASVLDAYDLDFDGLECAELSPACGGTLDRVSPGEEQVMDCVVQGDPGLCGIFRLDITSGGFAWDLFANCTGGAERNFRIFTSCADAWAAWNPLPEIALSSASATCPDGQVDLTLENLGCADVTGDIVVSAASSCPVPDVASWTFTGGLPAGARRTEREPFVVSCAPATVRLTVDPANLIAECSETPGAAACAIIPGADSLDVAVTDPVPTVDPLIFASRLPGNVVRFDWNPSAGAASYRVARGIIGTFYGHLIDEGSGIGKCTTSGATQFDDATAIPLALDFYFLVAPIGPCGSVGGWGTASDGTRRPPPTLVVPCP